MGELEYGFVHMFVSFVRRSQAVCALNQFFLKLDHVFQIHFVRLAVVLLLFNQRQGQNNFQNRMVITQGGSIGRHESQKDMLLEQALF
jgi:hypothetical protein